MAVVGPFARMEDERVDRALRDAVGAFEAAFPGRVRGCYVEGSHTDNTGVTSSDLDLTILFRDQFVDGVLVSQLRGADREGVRAALQVLARIPLLDPAIIGALSELERVRDEELGRLARRALARYDAL